MKLVNQLTVFTATSLLILTACSKSSGGSTAPPGGTPPDLSGSWTGALGNMSLLTLDMVEAPAPGANITGTGTLLTGKCSLTLDVTGTTGTSDYALTFTGTDGSGIVIDVLGQLVADDAFAGTYTVTANSGGPDSCLFPGDGTIDFGWTSGDLNGTFQGNWVGASTNSGSTMVLGQTGDRVMGVVSWDDYVCSGSAFLDGTLTADTLTGSLGSYHPADASYDVQAVWDSALSSLDGPWTMTSGGPGDPCYAGALGTASFSLVPPPVVAPTNTSGAVEVRILGVEESGETELLYRYRSQGQR